MKNFERTILAALFLIGIAFLPVALLAVLAFQRVVSEQNALIDVNATTLFLSERLRAIHAEQSAAMPLYLLAGDPEVLKTFETSRRNFKSALKELYDKENSERDRVMEREIDALSDRLYEITLPGVRMRRQGRPAAKIDEYFQREVSPLNEQRRVLIDQLVAAEAAELREARDDLAVTASRALWFLGAVSLIALGFVLIMTWLVRKMLLNKATFDRAQEVLLQQEQRISRARRDAIEVVAHDLKNPLATILMSAELLQAGAKAELTPEEGLQIIARSADSMNRLIKNLLDHAKIESGQLVVDLAELDFSRLLDDVCTRCEITAAAKNIRVVRKIESRLPRFRGDAVRLEQVLSNLLGNAVKFTAPGGTIRIEAGTQDDWLSVAVIDNGQGIASDDLPHIFERYWQARETAQQGTGLGLAIAKAVVEAHKGTISAESAQGRGSRFTIRLPLSDAATSPTKTPATAALNGR